MPTHLVQIADEASVQVALVDEPYLRCLQNVSSIYELAQRCLEESRSLEDYVRNAAIGEAVGYDDVYSGGSKWRLMAPIHVPNAASRLLISGTGLTHLGSARQRQVMHLGNAPQKPDETMTDSMRMFQWGVENGRPPEGGIGIAPEWFYKGDGSSLRGPFDALEIPGHAEDGGEEAELAGVYIVSASGDPFRIGIAQGNEFSDHKFEKRNYLNLAGSKLRTCSLGPEIVVDASFEDIPGVVQIERGGQIVWQTSIASGERNMCHSLANLEHHHFKFAGHRQPGMVHVHFFGADALSFGSGIRLEGGDVVEVKFQGFGRALRNPVRAEAQSSRQWRARSLV